MSRVNYPWQRFWHPRDSEQPQDGGGFLPDRNSEMGRLLYPNLSTLEELSGERCLILLGEPGMGKSDELMKFSRLTQERVEEIGDALLFFNLADYQSDERLHQEVFKDPKVQLWQERQHNLHLFLDSLDESRLRIDVVARRILRELTGLPSSRLFLRIACRVAEWPPLLETGLEEYFGQDIPKYYSMAQLRAQDVILAAERQGFAPEPFLNAVVRRRVVPLAVKPVTLEMLLKVSKDGELPSDPSVLYRRGCLKLCEEVNPSRRAARQVGSFTSEQRFAIACRIAAQILFGNQIGIWADIDQGDVPPGYLTVAQVRGRTEHASGSNFEVTEEGVRETLDTGLFRGLDKDRLVFFQRTINEFLAAEYLKSRNASLSTILSLITAAGDPERRVIPELRGVATWLAHMVPSARAAIMQSDPDVIIRSDLVPDDEEIRRTLTGHHLQQFEGGGRPKDWSLFPHYANLQHLTLSEQLSEYITGQGHHDIAREVAVEIARICDLRELQRALVDVALSKAQPIGLRIDAARAVAEIADSEHRAELKPLVQQDLPEDAYDELKAAALKAVWPEHLTPEELFAALTPPKIPNVLGAYRVFTVRDLRERMRPEDIASALDHIPRLGSRRSLPRSQDAAINAITWKAFQHLDLEGVLPALGRALVHLLPTTRKLIEVSASDSFFERAEPPQLPLEQRRAILVEVIKNIPGEGWPINRLRYARPHLVEPDDFPWLLEQLRAAATPVEKWAWSELVSGGLNFRNPEQVSAVLEACDWSPELATRLAPWRTAVDLDSVEAEARRTAHRDEEELEAELDGEAVEEPRLTREAFLASVNELIDLALASEPGAYARLDRALTLGATQFWFELDLTTFPGWRASDADMRERIIAAAHRYLVEHSVTPDEWFESSTINFEPLAGCRALALLLSQNPTAFDDLSNDIWARWTPAILNHPQTGSPGEMAFYSRLFCTAKSRAPKEFLRYFQQKIESEAGSSAYTPITLGRADACRDEAITSVLHELLRSPVISTRGFHHLLRDLLKHGEPDAVAYAASFVTAPAPIENPAREKAAIAAALLLLHSPDESWDTVWAALGDDSFAREAITVLASEEEIIFEARLGENRVADLYARVFALFRGESDPRIMVGWEDDLDFDNVVRLRNRLPRHLAQRATPEACYQLERMVEAYPDVKWLGFVLTDARKARWRNAWRPPTTDQILDLVQDESKRLVRDADELVDAILASLTRLQEHFVSETPMSVFLWNGTGATATHKDENHVSDFVKWFLEMDLSRRGIVLNREVEIRRGQGGQPGERTDIHVDAVIRGPDGRAYDVITVIVEVKGSWNAHWETAMETQLRDRYLADNRNTTRGVYLLGWFDNPVQEGRKAVPEGRTPQEVREQLEAQATALSNDVVRVRSFVLDVSLR